MNLQKLRYFIVIAEEKSISKASEKLHIAQPPLSRMIKQMEDDFDGVRLFIRTTRKMELTEAGEMLYERAKMILEMTDSTKQEIILADKGVRGILSIGVVDSIVTEVTQKYIVPFSEENDKVRYNMVAGNTDDIMDALDNQSIELGIVRYSFDKEKFYSIPYKKYGLAAFFPANLASDEKEITIEELSKYPLIIHYRYKALIEETFRRHEVNAEIRCSSNDAKAVYEFAKEGIGVAILPYMEEIYSKCEGVGIRMIEDENMQMSSAIIWRSDKKLSKVASHFLNKLQNQS